jgi:hypothetical protein
MKPESSRVAILFTQALELSTEQRGALLAQECSGDENLRLRVETLFKAQRQIGDSLEQRRRLMWPLRKRPSRN